MKCPYCAETIHDQAVLCRFCGARKNAGEWAMPDAETLATHEQVVSSRKTPPAKPKASTGGTIVAVLAMAAVGICVVVWFISNSGGNSGPARDDKSDLACVHFRNVASDVTKGILTPTELRQKLKEVDDDAVIATPAVKSAATRMLASSTSDGIPTPESIRSMGAACTAAGW